MSSGYRRYEILLPLRLNDGQPVGDELVAETLLELRQRFGAVSCETQTIRGVWTHQNQVFRDDLICLFVDVADTLDAREYFTMFKDQLRARFQQLDIWVTTYPIEVL